MSPKNQSTPSIVSRRQFLRMAGLGAATLAVSGVAATRASTVADTQAARRAFQDAANLKTAGWPFVEKYSEEQIAGDPGFKVYNDLLQAWLDKNPGVTVERIEFNIWDQQTLLTGLAGGTAPTAFHTTVLGSYNMAGTRAAFAQELAADVTEYYNTLGIDSKIAPYVKAQMGKWVLDGKTYALPTVFNPGVGIMYRKDFFTEAGVAEPTATWTWNDLKDIAKKLTTADRKGIALQRWAISWWLQSEGISQNPALGITTVVPDAASGWNWKYDFTTSADRIAAAINGFREMVFTDQSVFFDTANDDNAVFSAILDGRVAMAPLHPGFLRRVGAGSPDQVAKDLGKSFTDVWGWIQHPRGNSGGMGVTVPFLDAISYSPDATPAELKAAVGLYEYFYLGEAYEKQQVALWETTQDLKRVWGEYPTITGKTSFEGIPGTPAEAWGADVITNLESAANIAYPPEDWAFFPAQKNPSPTLVAFGDFTSRMSVEPEIGDIATELKAVEDSVNGEIAAFESSVSDAEFTEAARSYYAAQEEYLKANAPDFYNNVWKAWYEEKVKPVLA